MKYKILIAVIAVIFLLSIAGSLFVLYSPPNKTVRIVSDGEVIETVDLSSAEDRTFEVEYQGRTNTIEIKDGQIRVKDAECYDHTCVKMGRLHSASMPIVCLPNHLVIEFVGSPDDVDAVTR